MAGALDLMLEEVGNIVVGLLRESLEQADRKATGKTSESLEVVMLPGIMIVQANKSIMALELGRKPTPPGTPPSDPTLFEALKAWMAARGIDDRFRYVIAKKIHEQGFKGTPGVLSSVLDADRIMTIMETVLADRMDDIARELLEIINFN